ncbi:MAG: AP2 domain-containing protein [candidate division Zixibacteria bacterium]|nr:AP2 domain-containing protein [candidate division Zixibacteria bacterium]
MKEILLTQGKVAIVDDEDFEELNKYKWDAHISWHTYYVERGVYDRETGKVKIIKMHRQIMGFPEGKEIDHINHNGMDNRKCNLRSCEHWQNKKNGLLYKTNTSGFRGVSWYKRSQKWRAYFYRESTQKTIGYFDNIIEAARAYDEKAKELGEFAILNFGGD